MQPIWKPALAKAGVIPPRAKGAKPRQWQAAPKDGFHVLKHTYMVGAFVADHQPRPLSPLHA
ncbi:hypothetical protein SSP24_10610 [Streptomyces spinoverrucosus]|uniref:Uncharacterized protein n=1 Tax=Streptomyces spinoverrucosus TaxID=284043 RepID=A0A4Y3VEJ4_9ACTN|nr:hypothetical protein SSP24_10610 [Streptomyces spinoverrucosus]GHB35915.1 hypothetical protein GCM10010397_01960 [Streptomyces spinoverrucosus]